MLPFIEQTAIGNLFNFRESWFENVAANNYELIQTQVQVFTCPSVPLRSRQDNYHVIGAAAGDYGTISEVGR